MKYIYLVILTVLFSSCGIQKTMLYFEDSDIPKSDFNDLEQDYQLDYNDPKNWSFREDVGDYKTLLPKNYNTKKDTKFDISVFYIHPTTLYDSFNWNADTSYFVNNKSIDLCLENQASVFAGITDLYAPHYREMHIHSYSDSINGYKAYDVAYNDVLSAFKYFIKHIKHDKFIIASHSQGTNHAVRLIKEYISQDKSLLNRLLLSYLIGMNVDHNELLIPLCEDPKDLNCFLTWRSFNESYYPNNWKYGPDIYSVNPISFKVDSNWSRKKNHLGILFPNKKIYFKKTVSASNEQGLLWVRFPNSIFLKKYKTNSYHRADFNLYWLNIRQNLQERLNY